MSLINSVLRDLASRQAETHSKRPWQKEIRALPVASQAPAKIASPWITAAFIACIAGAAGYHFALWQSPHQSVSPAPSAVPSPAPAEQSKTLVLPETQALPPPSPPPHSRQALPRPPVQTSTPSTLVPSSEQPSAAKGKTAIRKSEASASTPRAMAENSLNQANALLAQGQTDSAIAGYYAALDHDPGFVVARQRLLNILERNGRRDEAAVVVADGLHQSPAQISWALWLSRYEHKKGNPAKASEILKLSEGFAKDNADFSGFQGHLALRQGDGNTAAQYYQNAVRVSPQDGRWWFGLAEAMSSTGDKSNAATAYQRALSTGNLPAALSDLATQRITQ